MFEDFAEFRAQAIAHSDKFCGYAREQKLSLLAARIKQFRDALDQTQYNIAVVGNVKRGKSTLLNAILGRRDDAISPIDEKVCTAAIVQYVDTGAPDEKEQAFVYFNNRSAKEEVSFSEIRQYVTEDRNPGNQKDVQRVEVHGYFPLLNKSVTLVDTPGRGATAKHHEAMVEQFLPNADAIIFPIAADLPIEASERKFLEMLRDQEKDRIFFVLTKYDELAPQDREEVEHWVRRQVQDAGLACHRLHKVAARDLYEARKRDASESEIEQIRKDCGVAVLESDLEAFILNTSGKNELVRQRVAQVLEECSSFCRNEIGRLEGEIQSFDRDVVRLEIDLNEVKQAAEKLRSERDKALRSFQKRWDNRISRFQAEMIRHADRISDAIIHRLQDRGFVKTLVDSTRLGTEVARRVDNEISPAVIDLEQQLGQLVSELNSDLNGQLEIYLKRSKLSNFQTSIEAAVGGSVLASAGIIGFTSVAAAWSSAAAAWSIASAATTTATTAAAQVGFMQAFWASLWGASATASTGGTVTAVAAKATATSAAIGATATSVAFGGLAIAGVYITKQIAHWGISALQENKVPDLVRTALEDSGTLIVSKLQERREGIARDYTTAIDELITNQEDRMGEIVKSLKDNDPSEKEQRVVRKQQLEGFMSGNAKLEQQMAKLPKLNV